MYYLIMPSYAERQSLIEHLANRDISSVFHYLPLHLSPMGRRLGGKEGDCPVTEEVSDGLLRLPFYNQMTDAELDRVVAALKSF
jgi:dTDP-4-amino-4,6-dideoxygalactose transaminase